MASTDPTTNLADSLNLTVKQPKKKQPFKAYNESGGMFSKQYDVARHLDPIDLLGNQFGFKNPLHQMAEAAFNGIAGTDMNNVNRVKFDNLNRAEFGGGFAAGNLKEEDFEKLYATMSPEELDQVGRMTDKDQTAWLKNRWSEVQSGKAKPWEDPSAPKKPGPAPDLTDELLRKQSFLRPTGRGRKSTFVGGY